jgi:cbb3-type cytochrome oxidase maturation protein
MNIIFVLIPLGIVLVAFAIWALFWAVGDGQFDDLESPGWSVLADDSTHAPRQPASPPEPPEPPEPPR